MCFVITDVYRWPDPVLGSLGYAIRTSTDRAFSVTMGIDDASGFTSEIRDGWIKAVDTEPWQATCSIIFSWSRERMPSPLSRSPLIPSSSSSTCHDAFSGGDRRLRYICGQAIWTCCALGCLYATSSGSLVDHPEASLHQRPYSLARHWSWRPVLSA